MRNRTLKAIASGVAVVGLLSVLPGSSPASGEEAGGGQWQNIEVENFEGVFPDGLWRRYDSNGTGANWDDESAHALRGLYSGHPFDAVTPVPDKSSTRMTYGPFSLVGATKARVLFLYELSAERDFDFLTWGFTCGNEQAGPWRDVTRSGVVAEREETMGMGPCLGRSKVWVRWTFRSDSGNGSVGAYIDNIRIQKFS